MSPRATAQDVQTWDELVKEARRLEARPELATQTLEKLAHRAKKAVLPRPPYTPENPFIELRRTCERFAALPAATRIKERWRLSDALKALDAQGGSDPADSWRSRRDIEG